MSEIVRRFVLAEEEGDFSYPADVERIVAICASKGIHISPTDAHEAWDRYSNSVCAGWIILPVSDEDIFEIVSARCKVIEELKI